MTITRSIIPTVILTIAVSACQTRQDAPSTDQAAAENVAVRYAATLNPTQGNAVTGTVEFTRTADGTVTIVADVVGLSPGKHGFHIHEKGDCSAPDGSSALGHFNPYEAPHGPPSAGKEGRHVGDLGNLTADDRGVAHYEANDDVVAFDGVAGIEGRGLIVHASEDDLRTQPTGAAGARVACGVISKQMREGA